MFEVAFYYNRINTIIQCNLNDKMKEILIRFGKKLGIDINTLYFLYRGKKLKEELTLEENININKDDIKLNKINIIVSDIDKEEEKKNEYKIKRNNMSNM